jgi:hypothetical protein
MAGGIKLVLKEKRNLRGDRGTGATEDAKVLRCGGVY